MGTASLSGAIDSSVMYLLETAHSSFLLEKDGADEPCDGGFVGKDADDVGATLDLGMEPFDRVCGVQFLAVLPGEAHVGEDVVLGFVHENCQLGDLGPELVGDLTPLDLRAVGVLLGEGGGDEGGDDAPALAAGMGQQVAGEVHAAALPCGAEDPGRGGLQALVVVGDHQLHAAQPAPGPASAGTRSRRSRPPTRRSPCPGPRGRPWSLTATATVTATETMRPVWRTFT